MFKENFINKFGFCQRTSLQGVISFIIVLVLPCLIIYPFIFPTLCKAFPRTSEDIIEISCGSNNVDGNRVLIAYDTVHGSTSEIAEKIGDILCEVGFQVDVRLARRVKDISEYDAVIVGTAIRELKWLLDAERFLRRHKKILSEIPVAYFGVCMALAYDSPEVQEMMMPIYMEPILEKYLEIAPVDYRLFGGAIDFTNFNIYEKLLIWGFGSTKSSDYRNWEKVTEWAEKLSNLLE